MRFLQFRSFKPVQLLSCLILWAPGLLSAQTPPNVIFILADDLGYGEVGFNGQKKILTPHLDRMAREGMVLSRHYSGNAVCAPSRAVLLTGLNPGQAPVRDNVDVGSGEQTPLPAGIQTLPALLKKAGYTTAVFGKWGLGGMDSTGNPLHQGFDRFLGLTSQREAHSHYPAALWDNSQRIPLRNGPTGVPGHAAFPKDADPKDPKSYASNVGTDFASDRFIAGAEAFISEHAKKPFFLYYACALPHVALQVPEDALKPYANRFPEDPPYTPARPSYVPNQTPRATYAAMITRLDAEVGRILSALEKAGVSRQTLVVFSSDNGTTHSAGGVDPGFFESTAGLRGLKGSLHEGGLRVPTVVLWPEHCPSGTRSSFLSGFEDWLPTFAEVAGIPVSTPVTGESLVPVLHGNNTSRKSALYREFPGYGHQQALWEGRWKAVRTDMERNLKDNGRTTTQLYDLEADPNETRDLASEHPAVVQELETKMHAAHHPDPAFPLAGSDPLPAKKRK
jgi:arylsulfatase A